MNRTSRTAIAAALGVAILTPASAAAAAPVETLVRCGPVPASVYGCEIWRSSLWDGGGGTSRDEAGDGFQLNSTISAVSEDGRLVFMSGIATGPANDGLEMVTIAVEASSGAQVWVRRQPGTEAMPRIGARALSVSPDAVFVTGVVGSEPGAGSAAAAFAYDPLTGEPLWRWDGPVIPYDAAISDDGATLYVAGTSMVNDDAGPSTSGELIAVDAATGTQLWRRTDAAAAEGRVVGTRVAVAPGSGAVTMAGSWVDGGGVTRQLRVLTYEARGDEAAGIEPGDLRSVGTFDYGTPGLSPSGLRYAPDGSRVYVSGGRRTGEGPASARQYVTAAFRVADGERVWASFFDGGITDNQAAHPTFGSPLGVSPAGSRVYVTGYIYDPSPVPNHYFGTVAYDAVTGAQVWQQTLLSGFVNCLFCLPNLAVNPVTGTVHVTGVSNHRINPQVLTASYRPDTGELDWAALVEDGASGSTTPVASVDGRRLFVPGWQAFGGNQRDLLMFAYDARG